MRGLLSRETLFIRFRIDHFQSQRAVCQRFGAQATLLQIGRGEKHRDRAAAAGSIFGLDGRRSVRRSGAVFSITEADVASLWIEREDFGVGRSVGE